MKPTPRDVRLYTSLIESHGIKFSNSSDAIIRCIDEYNLKINEIFWAKSHNQKQEHPLKKDQPSLKIPDVWDV